MRRCSETKDITDDLPFEVPDHWVWTRFSQIVSFDLGKTPDRHNKRYWNNGKYPWFTIADLQEMGSASSSKEKISEIALNEKFAGKLIPRGTLLMSFKLTVGKTSILDVDAVHNEAIISIFPIISEHEITRNFLLNALPVLVLCVKKRDAVKGATLNSSKLATMFIPLPPLSEQQRIVSQIEELFDQIAAIEQNQTDIATLYEEFRKRTLTLAIQGKLIPQNPNDEPANVLLKRIRAEKRAKLGKKYVDSFIYKGDDNCYYEHITGRAQDELVEIPFDIPDNWTWAKLLDLGGFSSGKTPDMSEPTYWQNGNVQWFTSKDMKTKYLTESQLKITELAAGDMTLYPANTLLWVVRSGILKSSLPICILKQPATINQDIKAYQLYQSDMIDYVYYMLKGMEAIILDNYVKRITTVHSLKFDELISKLAIPIPPLAEQKRIVAKINEVFVML